MAYPVKIAPTGPIDAGSDVFEYFRGATQSMLLDEIQSEYDMDAWEPVRVWMVSQTYPITRSSFNSIITTAFGESAPDLLSSSEPTVSWPLDKVHDWAKVQSFVLAIFGSASGSNSLSYLTGSVGSVSLWRVYDLSLLRYALVRFSDYGSCYIVSSQAPPPTNPITNTGARTFNWTNAPGFNSVGDYEYSLNYGLGYSDVTTKPIVIPSDMTFLANAVQVRTKGDGLYLEPSTSVSNDASYVLPYYRLEFLNTQIGVLAGQRVVSFDIFSDGMVTLPFPIFIYCYGTYYTDSTKNFSFDVEFPANTAYYQVLGRILGPYDGLPTLDFEYTSIDVVPDEFEGKPIQVIHKS